MHKKDIQNRKQNIILKLLYNIMSSFDFYFFFICEAFKLIKYDNEIDIRGSSVQRFPLLNSNIVVRKLGAED